MDPKVNPFANTVLREYSPLGVMRLVLAHGFPGRIHTILSHHLEATGSGAYYGAKCEYTRR